MIYLLQIFGAYPGDIFKSKRFQNKHTVERINTIFQKKYDIKHIKHIDESSNIFKTFKLNQIMPIWKKISTNESVSVTFDEDAFFFMCMLSDFLAILNGLKLLTTPYYLHLKCRHVQNNTKNKFVLKC